MKCHYCKKDFPLKDGILLGITTFQEDKPLTIQTVMCPRCEAVLHESLSNLLTGDNFKISFLDRSDSYYELKYDDVPYEKGEEK